VESCCIVLKYSRLRAAPASRAAFAAPPARSAGLAHLWLAFRRAAILHRVAPGFHGYRSDSLETHGPFGILWVGLGLCAFYIALVWINTLLGFLLTPLFTLPATRLLDRIGRKNSKRD
jgi:hypothetical protein